MKRYSLLISVLLLSAIVSFAQNWSAGFFKGYEKALSTGKFSYHSPQPDVTQSLLLRSIDSASFIAWETESVPLNYKEEMASFIWMFGIDATPNSYKYRLYVNGVYLLTFSNPLVSELKPWTIQGKPGTSLTFRTTMLDKYDDPMGYAILKLPASTLVKGKPQQIKVVGESAGSNVWYMTFEAGIEEKVDVLQEDAILKNQGKPAYSVVFNFVHLGEKVKGELEIPGIPKTRFTLEPGFTRVETMIPSGRDTGAVKAKVTIEGKAPYYKDFRINPVKKWTIYLVQHSHTDIGYTRPQTEILPEHLRYIDYALDYCDQTDGFPEEARFRWTCETSWAVKEYLATRPAIQVDRLKRRIKEGRIEVTGLFLNSSDLGDETSVVNSLQPVKEFRSMGIPVKAAMQNDINGVPWCLVDYLSGCGIDYLNMGQNTHRALKPFDRPTTFWWESPSGKRIMVNRPEHYMWGNQLGILTNAATFGKSLFLHLNDIEKKGYPYDHYALQFSGYLTDNSPPSTTACKVVAEWNEKYTWPKLKLATISEFGEYMKKNHTKDLPTYRGAWPDWWMDGFGSAFLETAYTRMAHEDYIVNDGLMAMVKMMGEEIPDHLLRKQADAAESILFYDEHTFGAAESISDPLIENSIVQWGEKGAYAWEAVKKNRLIREEVLGILQPFIPKSTVPVITVFNTLNWDRSGIATVYVDHQIIPKSKSFKVLDVAGNPVPIQAFNEREEGTYWAMAIQHTFPFGFSNYRVVVSEEVKTNAEKKNFTGTLENERYLLKIDKEKGTISSLFDKKLHKELVNVASPYQMGQFIYERLGKNRNQLELLKLTEFTRTSLTDITISDIVDGPVWSSVKINGKIKECCDKEGVTCEVRLYRQGDCKIELLYSMKKLAVSDPEAVYVAFPFAKDQGVLHCEMQGGTMIPGRDQIPGSASDWQGIQNFVSIRNKESQVVFVSPEAPLVQLGDINTGKFARNWQPQTPSVFSWVLNNYWTTNFRAYQEGELKWSYRIFSSADTSNLMATRAGWGERVPYVTRVFPGMNDTTSMKPELYPQMGHAISLLGPAADRLLLVSAKPSADKKGIVLQLREVSGKPVVLPLELPVYSSAISLKSVVKYTTAMEVNVLEENIHPLGDNLTFGPGEVKFLKLVY
jgi:alpha-mannosidase